MENRLAAIIRKVASGQRQKAESYGTARTKVSGCYSVSIWVNRGDLADALADRAGYGPEIAQTARPSERATQEKTPSHLKKTSWKTAARRFFLRRPRWVGRSKTGPWTTRGRRKKKRLAT